MRGMTREFSPQRLLYVHTAPVPSKAANSIQVVKTCQALADRGIEVALFCPGDVGANLERSIVTAYGLDRVGFRAQAVRRWPVPGGELLMGVRSIISAKRPTLLYTRSVSVAFAAASLGLSVALELHDAQTWRPALATRFAQLTRSQRLRRVVVISQRLADFMTANFPDLAGRVTVAHDASDPVSNPPPAPAVIHRNAECLNVGYVGHLYPGKGMEMIAALAPRLSSVTFHVVGGTDVDLARWRGRLSQARNVFFYGHQPHQMTPQFIQAFDVLVAPYSKNVQGVGGGGNLADWMSPLKIFEYMAAGRPIVSSDLPVLREVLTDGVNALLAEPDNVDSWAEALTTLARDRKLRARLGARAQTDFLAGYTWEHRARTIADSLFGPSVEPEWRWAAEPHAAFTES
jgi:glycosyltransferase involved in cell wall biosynthesis